MGTIRSAKLICLLRTIIIIIIEWVLFLVYNIVVYYNCNLMFTKVIIVKRVSIVNY